MTFDSTGGCGCSCNCGEANSCSEFSVKFEVLLGLDTGAIEFKLGVEETPGLNNNVLEEFEYADDEAGLSLFGINKVGEYELLDGVGEFEE